MDDIVKNEAGQNAEEPIAYDNLPARELIKVTDENATVLWTSFCDAMETAEELFKESEYYGTSLFLKARGRLLSMTLPILPEPMAVISIRAGT